MKRTNFQKIITFAPFILLGIVTISLIVNSFIEKGLNNPTETSNLYTSPFMLLLWGGLTISSLFSLIKQNQARRLSLLLFHYSLLLMLLGACITHFTHESGIIHLREGIDNNKFSSFKDNRIKTLPFYLNLTEFSVINYPGTTTPSDYKSIVKIKTSNHDFQATISMNNILKQDGFRFYQTSFDNDLKGSILTVTYDKWGVRLTYMGYGLLFLSMLLIIVDPKSKFRSLLKNKRWETLLIIFLFSGNSDECFSKNMTLTKEELEVFEQILIEHQGRITTIENFATDFTKKISGKNSYKDYSATEILCGWIFRPEIWQNEPMFKVSGFEKQILEINSDKAKFTDFFNSDKSYKIEHYLSKPGTPTEKEKRWKKASQLDEKAQLIFMLHSGELMKIFPVTNKNNTELISPNKINIKTLAQSDSLLINNFFPLLYESINSAESCKVWIEKFKKYQIQTLGKNAPSDIQLKAEHIYLKVNILPHWGYLTLCIGFIAFFVLCYQLSKDIRIRNFHKLSLGFLIVSFTYLTFILLLHGIISGRLPFSNGHETLLSIAWFSQLGAILFRNKIKIVIPMGILISGFALLGASLSDANPQITPLMPILNSPLLSIHVSLMMLSYTFIGFISIISILVIILYLFNKNNEAINNLTLLSNVLLYPTLFFMTAGIFIGAIWANVSWGNYWSWDPKETWALISMLYYAIAIHNESLPFLRKPIYFHLYLLVGLLLILTTYFGVNYYFGGMHSYA